MLQVVEWMRMRELEPEHALIILLSGRIKRLRWEVVALVLILAVGSLFVHIAFSVEA